MKSDRLGHASPSRGGLSGQNDDSSVVSLKALVAKADPALSTARAPAVDDSGLIDLKKLMANARPSSDDALPPVLAPSEAGLFSVPENTPLPHVMQTPGSSADATANSSESRLIKWLAATALLGIVAAGVLGTLHGRAARVPQVEHGVAAAVPVTTNEPGGFVQTPPPVETAPAAVNVAPVPTETKAPDAANLRGRQAAVHPPSRERTRQEPTKTGKVEEKQPASGSCDLMCEIARRAQKTKK